MKEKFNELLRQAESICVLGHISPDGDCAGSTLGVYNYIENICEKDGLRKKVKVYLEELSDKFAYLPGYSGISHDTEEKESYELAVVCDCGDFGRLGKYMRYAKEAKSVFCADHHITNSGFGDNSVIKPDASSTCEVVYDLFDEVYIDKDVAECIYTGIVHDTGVFRYSCTSGHTMSIAGKCMDKGIDFGSIIDDSFFSMSFQQKKILAKVLTDSVLSEDGKIVTAYVNSADMKAFSVGKKDMDGIIDELRTTGGVLCAIFMYQMINGQYKISMRSNTDELDVSTVAAFFGGGGHVRAAGCSLSGKPEDIIAKLTERIRLQIG